jgi:hypothetical protein
MQPDGMATKKRKCSTWNICGGKYVLTFTNLYLQRRAPGSNGIVGYVSLCVQGMGPGTTEAASCQVLDFAAR